MRLCLHECAPANRRDGSRARKFFQATQHGVSSFGKKWFLLNGDTHTHTQAHARRAKHPGSADWVELKSCRVTAALRHNSTALNNGGCYSMRAAVAA